MDVLADDEVDGAAAVEVHKVDRNGLVEHLTALGQVVRVRPAQLYAEDVLGRVTPQQRPLRRLALQQILGEGHLTASDVRAESFANPARRGNCLLDVCRVSVRACVPYLRKGRFPRVVSGARYNLSFQSICDGTYNGQHWASRKQRAVTQNTHTTHAHARTHHSPPSFPHTTPIKPARRPLKY